MYFEESHRVHEHICYPRTPLLFIFLGVVRHVVNRGNSTERYCLIEQVQHALHCEQVLLFFFLVP